MKLSFEERKEIIEELINNEYIQKRPTSSLTKSVVITKSKYYVGDPNFRHSIMNNLTGKEGVIEITSTLFETLPDVDGYAVVDVQYNRIVHDYKHRYLDGTYAHYSRCYLERARLSVKVFNFDDQDTSQVIICDQCTFWNKDIEKCECDATDKWYNCLIEYKSPCKMD